VKRSKWTSDLHWVREGKQDRSRKTQAALLDAAEELFSDQGIGGATIADISSAAGCSIGAFYHHYRDKRAVQFAVFERYANEFEETVRVALEPSRWEGAGVADILLGYLQVSVDGHRELPHRVPAIAEIARAEPEVQNHLLKLRVMLDVGIRELVLTRRSEIGHENPELAVTFVLDQLGSMLRTRRAEPDMPSRFATHSDDEFVQEALGSVCAYLQVSRPVDSADGA
jgi:AcrR family transcriptional regulator